MTGSGLTHRLPLAVRACGWERWNRVLEFALEAPAPEGALRVVETSISGDVLDAGVPCQIDGGRMVSLLMKDSTSREATRRYELLFAADGTAAGSGDEALVSATDGLAHEGQESIRVDTPSAVYWYHKEGAGFASIEDADGNDWVGYHPTEGPEGSYRGVPNIAPAAFHPGAINSRTRILSRGPLKASIHSETKDGEWACRWDIYPWYASFTLLKKDPRPYWFLYEGTPGGAFNESKDWFGLSTGERYPTSVWWNGTIDPQWVYFGSNKSSRVFYMVNHENEPADASFWPHSGRMTVFGFGRQVWRPGIDQALRQYLMAVPARFSIGFAENASHDAVSLAVCSASMGLSVSQGKIDRLE